VSPIAAVYDGVITRPQGPPPHPRSSRREELAATRIADAGAKDQPCSRAVCILENDKEVILMIQDGSTLAEAQRMPGMTTPTMTTAGNTDRRQSPPVRRVARVMWT